jgi:hypothetical protein
MPVKYLWINQVNSGRKTSAFPLHTFNNQPWYHYEIKTSNPTRPEHCNQKTTNMATPRHLMATCFQWHVASHAPSTFVKTKSTWMCRRALCRILRLEDFFSSCEAGNWRFKSSKHSFKCARRFFSNLLCTSRVPALQQDTTCTTHPHPPTLAW